MKIINVFIALLLLGCAAFNARGALVILEWDANSEANLAGYNVYAGSAPRVYTNRVDAGLATSHTNDYTPGEYFLAVTAYDTDGLESDFSDELALFIVTPPTPRFESNTLVWTGHGSWRVRWTSDTSTNTQIFATNRVALGIFPPGSRLEVQRYELGTTNILSDYSAPLRYEPLPAPRRFRIRVALQKSGGVDQPFTDFAEAQLFDAEAEQAFYRARLEIAKAGLWVR